MPFIGASFTGVVSTSEWPFIVAVILIGVLATAGVVFIVIAYDRRHRAPRGRTSQVPPASTVPSQRKDDQA